MSKRGPNIYKRKDGRWEGRYKNGFKPDGKTKYSSVYGKSYSAVREKLDVIRAEVSKGKAICKCTFGELANLWLLSQKSKVKESTYANYSMKLHKHILPFLSGIKYEKVTAEKIYDFIEKKKADGLSCGYIADIVTVIKSIARFGAKVYGYANRIEFVSLPRNNSLSEKSFLSDNDRKKLHTELISSRSSSDIGILLASVTGIRIGELCALKWENIDLEKNILTVSHTVQRIKDLSDSSKTRLIITSPKSRSSFRDIPLPRFIVPILRKIKSADGNYLLSCSEKVVEPRTMQYRFKSLLKRLELRYVSFHALRHMFATNCVTAGFDIKTLSEILGHSSAEITLSRYVHSSIERKRACMNLISA